MGYSASVQVVYGAQIKIEDLFDVSQSHLECPRRHDLQGQSPKFCPECGLKVMSKPTRVARPAFAARAALGGRAYGKEGWDAEDFLDRLRDDCGVVGWGLYHCPATSDCEGNYDERYPIVMGIQLRAPKSIEEDDDAEPPFVIEPEALVMSEGSIRGWMRDVGISDWKTRRVTMWVTLRESY